MSPKLSRRSSSFGTPEKPENPTENGFEADGDPERSAAQFVPIDLISLPESQPRRYFDEAGMQQLTASVKDHGILQPIIVRPVGEKYEVVAGERRYRAALEAGLTEVPALVREMSDEQAVQYALVENLQREDLNPLEEVEGILQLLALKLKTDREGAISLLNQMANVKRGFTDNVVRNEEQQIVEEVFGTIGRLSPESFRTHRLPLLKLPDDIQSALRRGRIEYTKAKEIARIKEPEKRLDLLEKAIADEWSLSQIKEQVGLLTEKKSLDTVNPLSARLDATYKQIKTSIRKNPEFWETPQTQEGFLVLLAELETFLSTTSQD
jgi:ParB family chromosome partitioning protein